MFQHLKHIIIGMLGGLALLVFYFIFLTLANSFSHAIEQFSQIWYWILILVVGFGIQVGFYSCIREAVKKNQLGGLATSGTISAGSMIVCCLHHLTDVLPIMGLAAAALFLTKYQTLFLLVGALSNLIGIIIMLEFVQKNNLAGSFLKKILIFPLGKTKKATIVFSLILVSILFFGQGREAPATSPATINLSSKTNSQAGISFEVTPLDFSFGQLVKFEIKINTHSGSLDFDLAKTSILEDDSGNQYYPLEWQGSGPGGHHSSGSLTFPKLENQPRSIRLLVQDNPQRVFEWSFEN